MLSVLSSRGIKVILLMFGMVVCCTPYRSGQDLPRQHEHRCGGLIIMLVDRHVCP